MPEKALEGSILAQNLEVFLNFELHYIFFGDVNSVLIFVSGGFEKVCFICSILAFYGGYMGILIFLG